jgi:CRISPR-associated protein Csm1
MHSVNSGSLERSEDLYSIALYALLHDTGKPIVRLAFRAREGLESPSDYVRNRFRELFGIDLSEFKGRHSELSDKVFIKLIGGLLGYTFNKNIFDYVRKVVKVADPLAAAERGFENKYLSVVEELQNKFNEISNRLGERYEHYTAPLLLPTWILLKSKYEDYVGPKAYAKGMAGKWSSRIALKVFLEDFLKEFVEAVQSGDVDKLVSILSNLLISLKNEEIWLPVNHVDVDVLLELRSYTYSGAVKKSNYSNVVGSLFKLLDSFVNVIGKGETITRGVVNTVNAILSSSLMFVPSAVVGTIAPDISLYSHSKLVAAYASALYSSSNKKVRWVVVDVNNIQKFISAPVKAAASSRILRGRSLLVELILDAVSEYLLELFGGLPQTNIVVSEGGTVDAIVPDLKDFESRIEQLKTVLRELAEQFEYSIGFTVSYSAPISIEDFSFLQALVSNKGLPQILEKQSRMHALERLRQEARIAGSSTVVKDYDTLTLEPITSKQEYRLLVNEDNLGYVEAIAGPGKLAVGDNISEPTHLSLIAGTVSRNLVSVISIHAYTLGDTVQPSKDIMRYLADKLRVGILSCHKEYKYANVLACTGAVVAQKHRVDLAIIPLTSIGSIYILVGLHDIDPFDPSDYGQVMKVWTILGYILNAIHGALNSMSQDLKDLQAKTRISIEVMLVNSPQSFIPSKSIAGEAAYEVISKVVKKLRQGGVDIGFRYILTNAYHPTVIDASKKISLVDLEQYDVVATAKIDLDSVGEVRKLLSHTPSRLATFSDLTNLVVAAKAYLHVVRYFNQLKPSHVFDVIALYAGGDDVTIYGRWSHVLYYLSRMYDEVLSVLRPLSASAGVAIDRSKVPILELYSRALSQLDEAKSVKGSVAIEGAQQLEYKVGNKLVSLKVFPPSVSGGWVIDDDSVYWNLKFLAETLWRLSRGNDVAERLNEYKSLLHTLAQVAYETSSSMHQSPLARLRLKVLYAYLWSRRVNDLTKLNGLLKELRVESKAPQLPIYPDDYRRHGADEVLRIISNTKPILDYIILALRRPESVKPTRMNVTH